MHGTRTIPVMRNTCLKTRSEQSMIADVYTRNGVYWHFEGKCSLPCELQLYITYYINIYIYKKRFHNVISIKMLFICYKFQSTCTRQCVAICIFNLIFILLGHLFILTQLIGSSLPEVTAGYATWIHLRCVWKLWNSYRVDLDVRACGLNIGTTKGTASDHALHIACSV